MLLTCDVFSQNKTSMFWKENRTSNCIKRHVEFHSTLLNPRARFVVSKMAALAILFVFVSRNFVSVLQFKQLFTKNVVPGFISVCVEIN